MDLFPRQEEIIKNIISKNTRFNSINASRQFSKTFILENLLMYYSLNFKNTKCLYITPTFSLSKIVLSRLYDNLSESGVVKSYNKTDNEIKFINNSEIYFRSGTNADNIRGLSVNYAFIDEAAFMSDDVWNVARPCLNVIGKKMILCSTPRGKQGFFYKTCELGMNGENENYSYNFGHYSDNPFYSKLEVEDARNTLPNNIYRQEYEGEFIDGGGSVFEFKKSQIITEFKGNKGEGPYSIGIDLGRQQDYTVVTVLNSKVEVVEIYRDQKKDWTTIINNISSVIKKYPNNIIYCETNGIGDVVFDLLKRKHPQIREFITTNDSKNEIIENLVYSFQIGEVKIPTSELFPPLNSELNTFTFSYSPRTRRIIYKSLDGFHDDCVISLSLALHGRKKPGKLIVY